MGRACKVCRAWEAYADVGQFSPIRLGYPEGEREVLLVRDVHDRVAQREEGGRLEVALDGLTRAAFCAARAPSWTPSCSLGVATLTTDDRCCAPDSLAAARSANLFSLSEQENLASKLKVEVCVRTGTKFVSEQGLRLNVRVSPWRLGGRAVC